MGDPATMGCIERRAELTAILEDVGKGEGPLLQPVGEGVTIEDCPPPSASPGGSGASPTS
jgi:hypothetical protein